MKVITYKKNPSKNTNQAIVFLHGFPSETNDPKVDPKTFKNNDIAQMFHKEFHHDTYLLHYKGLGETKGVFSFPKSLEDSLQFCKGLNHYSSIFLVGHSWGGTIALNAIRALDQKITGLILLAPYSKVSPNDTIKQLLEELKTEVPRLYDEGKEIKDYLDEMELIRQNHNPHTFLPSLSYEGKVLIFQPPTDDIVHKETSLELKNLLGDRCLYEEVDTCHSFRENRNEALRQIVIKIREEDFL